MSAYDLRPVTADDASIARVAALLRAVFPKAAHFRDDVVRWQYRDNPNGEAVGFNAWSGDELAAHYVTIPLLARIHGKEERGLLSLNTATHPAHQGKGLFTKLADATYRHGAQHGFGFVIGVANGNSTHGFTKKLGFQLVSPLRAMIGIGRLPERRVTDVIYEQVWHARTLAWRLAHPAFRYSIAEDGGRLLVLSERRQFGARYLLAVMNDATMPASLRHEPAPLRKAWIGLDPAMRWRGSFYMNVPMRFRPSPLNLIFKDLTEAGRTLDVRRVRFQAMDFDVL